MDKYISNIDELNLGKKINGGSCSSIHEFIPNFYFKRFEEDYQDLSNSINMEFYEVIKYLSSIKGMPYIVRATDIYHSQSELFGYSMPIIQGENFQSISDEVLVKQVLTAFKILANDIRVLAKNHVKTEDIGGDNIFYNGFMYLLDLDLSLIDMECSPDELYERTMRSVLYGIKEKILGDSRYSDRINIEDWENYFNKLIEMTSTVLGEEIRTIKEMKKGYQKVKSLYKI